MSGTNSPTKSKIFLQNYEDDPSNSRSGAAFNAQAHARPSPSFGVRGESKQMAPRDTSPTGMKVNSKLSNKNVKKATARAMSKLGSVNSKTSYDVQVQNARVRTATLEIGIQSHDGVAREIV